MKVTRIVRYIISLILMVLALFAGVFLNIENVRFESAITSVFIWLTIFGAILQLAWIGFELSLTDTREEKLKVELKEKSGSARSDILMDEDGNRINSYTWDYIEYQDGYRLIKYNHDIVSDLHNNSFSIPVIINNKPVICIDMAVLEQISEGGTSRA